MKVCDYCGQENGDSADLCVVCGKPLKTPEEIPPVPPHAARSLLHRLPRSLNAASATIVLLAEFSAQFGSVALVATGAIIVAMTQGGHGTEQLTGVLDNLKPAMAVAAPLVGVVAVILTSLFLFPIQIKDASPTGAAWRLGRWLAIAQGLGIGLILSIGYSVFRRATGFHVDFSELNTFDRMARSPGLPRITWLFAMVFVAPPAEELLFRGVLYGGYRKSFGPIWALILSTVLFLLEHISQVNRFPPLIVGLTGLSLAALWCRLRLGGIGPAIAAHIGYNAVPVFSVVFR